MSYIDKNFKYTDPEGYDKRLFSNPLESYVTAVWYNFLKDEVRKITQEKIVAELGCGTCEYTQHMDAAKEIYAIDISQEMINFGKNKIKNLNNVRFLLESATNTSLPDNHFDTVIVIGLIDYVNPELLMTEVRRITKIGGYFIITFPNKYNFHHIFMRIYGKIFKRNRKKEFSLFKIKKLIKKYNFKIEKVKSHGMIFYTRGRLQKYCVPIWKFLDFIYAPFQNIFPLGCNIYIKTVKND